MPVLEAEEVEILEGEEPTSEDFKISEAISLSDRDADEAASLVEAFVQDKDRAEQLAEAVRTEHALVLDLIRPCIGRGRGKHLYKAEMLEANAAKFSGWKMYLNHLSDQARRALGGLPRDVRDLGGIVQETWWNPDVPASGRFGKGAVQGVVSPVPLIQELHRVDKRLVECSINATATACKPGKIGNERVMVVEGIEEKGSVDWVTEAGAGGRVASIMEALIDDDSELSSALDGLDNGTLLAWIEQHRPELAEAVRGKKKPAEGSDEEEADESDDQELAEMAKDLLKSGKASSQAQAMALAKQALAKKKAGKVSESDTGGDEVPEISPEVLTEALASDEGRSALSEAIGPVVVAAVKELDLGQQVLTLVESKLEDDREVIRVEAEARADRRNELRDMRDAAHRKIDESKLHPSLKAQVRSRFDLVEGSPTPALDLTSDEDEDGKVVKSATAKLNEAVEEEISAGLKLMGELNPTRVRGQGAREQLSEGKRKEGEEGDDKRDTVGPTTRSLLESSGITADAEKVYEHSL